MRRSLTYNRKNVVACSLTCKNYHALMLYSMSTHSSRHIRLSYHSLCLHYYTTNAHIAAYAETIILVGNDVDWMIPDKVQGITVNQPKQRHPVGRLRKQRIPSAREDVIQQRCSRCSQVSHNRATFRNPIMLNPSQ